MALGGNRKVKASLKEQQSAAHTNSYLISTLNLITLHLLMLLLTILVSCALGSGLNHAQESGPSAGSLESEGAVMQLPSRCGSAPRGQNSGLSHPPVKAVVLPKAGSVP